MKLIFLMMMVFTCGCITEVKIDAVKPWEGHYTTTNEFFEATKNISLQKNESIWVLSNNTLKRVLKNTER